jgi:hemin uptake protein HemP
MHQMPPRQTPPDPPPKPAGGATLIRSRDWFGTSTVVFIEHGGERYQLRQTRSGKLILTK